MFMNSYPVSDVYDEVDHNLRKAFLCTLFSQISVFDLMEALGFERSSRIVTLRSEDS